MGTNTSLFVVEGIISKLSIKLTSERQKAIDFNDSFYLPVGMNMKI